MNILCKILESMYIRLSDYVEEKEREKESPTL